MASSPLVRWETPVSDAEILSVDIATAEGFWGIVACDRQTQVECRFSFGRSLAYRVMDESFYPAGADDVCTTREIGRTATYPSSPWLAKFNDAFPREHLEMLLDEECLHHFFYGDDNIIEVLAPSPEITITSAGE